MSDSHIETTVKSTLGFLGSIGAMTINDMAGLVVAILTGVYMIIQIDIARHKRNEIKDKKKGKK